MQRERFEKLCASSIPQTHLALDAGLVYNLVNVIGGDAGDGGGGSQVEDFARELGDLAHGFYALGVENLKLGAAAERAAVLGVAIFGPHGVGDRPGDGAVLGEGVDGSQGAGKGEAREGVVVTGGWIW